MSKQQFIDMAHYNQWANNLLYRACVESPKGTLSKDVGAFFGSIFKTLNHILLAEEIWMGRFSKQPFAAGSLDIILAENFDHLATLRLHMDSRIIHFVEAFDDTVLDKEFCYNDMAGKEHSLPFSMCLSHMFNHATHHRGQVHHILSTFDLNPPQLDLIYYLIEQKEGDH